jgi:replicative DNA helicase
LSSVLAGGAIPPDITSEAFLVPRHRLIFEVLCQISRLGLIRRWLDNLSLLENFLQGAGLIEAAGGRDFIRSLPEVCGIPAASSGLSAAIIKLHAGRRQEHATSTKN